MWMRAGRVLCLGAALWAPLVAAQIVNVQPLVGAKAEEEGFSFGADLSFDYRSGSIDLLLLSATATPRFSYRQHLLFLLLRVEQGYQGDAPFLSRDFEHLRYRYTLTPRWMAEAFVQHDRDRFRRLLLRALAGAGLRWEPLKKGVFTLALGAAYMAEFEQLSSAPKTAVAARLATLAHRVSSYASGVVTLSENARAATTAYLQPRLDDPRDLRALVEAEIIAAIGGPFSLKTSATVAYDSQPPPGLPAVELAARAALHVAL